MFGKRFHLTQSKRYVARARIYFLISTMIIGTAIVALTKTVGSSIEKDEETRALRTGSESIYYSALNKSVQNERLSHTCNSKLPSSKELTVYPFSEWRVSRFMAYYNIYQFLTRKWKYLDGRKVNVLDVGGSVFLGPFNQSTKITLTKNPGVDIHSTGFPANSFDVIAADQVLEHLVYPQAAMLEMHRVLKPGGIAIITSVAYNPLHEEKHYHDFWRFLPDGLKLLSLPFNGGIKICGSWGSKDFIKIRSTFGVVSRKENEEFRNKRLQLLLSNDYANAVLVWMIVEK